MAAARAVSVVELGGRACATPAVAVSATATIAATAAPGRRAPARQTAAVARIAHRMTGVVPGSWLKSDIWHEPVDGPGAPSQPATCAVGWPQPTGL
jgi:hypothetical protein